MSEFAVTTRFRGSEGYKFGIYPTIDTSGTSGIIVIVGTTGAGVTKIFTVFPANRAIQEVALSEPVLSPSAVKTKPPEAHRRSYIQ